MSFLDPVRRICAALLAFAVLAAVGVALAVAVVPAVAGASAFTVLSPSMVPALQPGAVVVVRPVPPDAVAPGDVLTFTARDPGASATRVVTHRVVAVEPGPVFRTRGDANVDPDPGLVAPSDVHGALWYSVPWVGGAAGALRSPAGLLGGGGVVLLLLGALLLPGRTREEARA